MTKLETKRIELDEKTKFDQVLQELSIPMEKRDIFFKDGKKPLDRFQAIVRTDTARALSVVSPGYQLVNHGQALRGFLQGLEQEGWRFTRISLERDGAHAFVELTLPKMILVEDDKGPTFPRLVMTHSVDLRTSLKAMFGAYRQVCTNGMVVPDRRFQNLTMRAVHVGPMMEKFGQFNSQIGEMLGYLQKGAQVFKGMLNQKVSDKLATKILQQVVGKRQIDRLLGLWDAAPGQPANNRTQWGLYNAITWWLTHEASGGVYHRDLRSMKAVNLILANGRSLQN